MSELEERVKTVLKTHSFERPDIICICGSSRFIDTMAVLAWIFEKEGCLAFLGTHLLPSWYTKQPDHQAEYEGFKNASEHFETLHRWKIQLADKVFVANVNGYIGEGTRRMIQYALGLKIPIEYLEPLV